MFLQKKIWKTLLSVGVMSAQTKKEKQFSEYFFCYRELFSWKTYFEWFGKIYQMGYSGMLWKNYNLEKKLFLKNLFHEMFFWMVLLSVGVQRSEDRIQKSYLGPLFLNKESLPNW